MNNLQSNHKNNLITITTFENSLYRDIASTRLISVGTKVLHFQTTSLNLATITWTKQGKTT